jgi:hypothetical protein
LVDVAVSHVPVGIAVLHVPVGVAFESASHHTSGGNLNTKYFICLKNSTSKHDSQKYYSSQYM